MKISINPKNVYARLLSKRYIKPVVFVTAFAIIATAALLITRAQDGDIVLEVETAAKSGKASFVDDDKASGGKSLHFGIVPGTGTPTTSYKPLSNPAATQQAKNVYNYLQSIEGKNILAGQHEQDNCGGGQVGICEQEWIKSVTGKMPAIHGHDVASYAEDPIRVAIDDWNIRRQIPTFSWHIGVPGSDDNFATINSSVDVAAAATPGTSEYAALVSKFDTMAQRLQTLEDANVPVLWRPWHEMDGNDCWFWWCKSGSEAYKKLWVFQYDYFTKTKGLNNLIWVWSSSESLPPKYEWYPGDAYVDIVGTDTYHATSQVDSVAGWYAVHKQNAPDKLVAQTETNHIPDPDQLKSQNIKIMWFLPWYHSSENYFEDANNTAYLSQVYNSAYVITADEMPDLKTTFQ